MIWRELCRTLPARGLQSRSDHRGRGGATGVGLPAIETRCPPADTRSVACLGLSTIELDLGRSARCRGRETKNVYPAVASACIASGTSGIPACGADPDAMPCCREGFALLSGVSFGVRRYVVVDGHWPAWLRRSAAATALRDGCLHDFDCAGWAVQSPSVRQR